MFNTSDDEQLRFWSVVSREVGGMEVYTIFLLTFIGRTWRHITPTLWLPVLMLAVSFSIEFGFRKIACRKIKQFYYKPS